MHRQVSAVQTLRQLDEGLRTYVLKEGYHLLEGETLCSERFDIAADVCLIIKDHEPLAQKRYIPVLGKLPAKCRGTGIKVFIDPFEVPNSLSSFTAPFGPMPLTPGMLSAESPMSER